MLIELTEVSGSEVLVNTDSICYVKGNVILFNNLQQLNVLESAKDINSKIKNLISKKYQTVDANGDRIATEKQIAFTQKICSTLQIPLPKDFKFETIKIFLDKYSQKYYDYNKSIPENKVIDTKNIEYNSPDELPF